MDFSTEKSILNRCEKLYEGSSEQSIDCEINLPDYCSDIQRILKCDAEVNVKALQQTGERVSAEGEIVLRLIYVNADEKPDCYEQLLPLSRYVEVKGLDGNFCISARPNVEFLNCRASSQRRASVNGKVSVRFTVEQAAQQEFISCAQGDGIQTLTQATAYDKLVGMTDKAFDMSETVSLSDEEAAVGGVIHCSATAVVSSIKSIANKLLIKGDLIAELIYFADSDDREVITKHHTMPMSQIIEINGIDDKSVCCAALNVMSAQIQTKTDSNGKNRLLEVNCRVAADVKAYEKTEASIITDSYCTDYEMKSEYNSCDIMGGHSHTEEEKTVRCIVEAGSAGVSVPLGIWCRNASVSAYEADGRLVGKGSVPACMLYADADGKTVYVEKTVDFEFSREMQKGDSRTACDAGVVVRDVGFTKIGGDKIEIKMDLLISADMYETQSKRICTDMSVDRHVLKNRNKSALTIYYTENGERVWDIAKNYCTSVQAIKTENGLDADMVSERTMLMIPMC